MTENTAIDWERVRTVVDVLPLLYVYLRLDMPSATTSKSRVQSINTTVGSAPLDLAKLDLAERIERLVLGIDGYLEHGSNAFVKRGGQEDTVDVLCDRLLDRLPVLRSTEAGHACAAALLRLHKDVEDALGLGRYVQLLVAPCPACDRRALVMSAGVLTFTCEVCAYELTKEAYQAHARSLQHG